MPREGGSLQERLQDRQRYYAELTQNITDDTAGTSGGIYTSRTDTGHPYSSLKWYVHPAVAEMTNTSSGIVRRGIGGFYVTNTPDDGTDTVWPFPVTKVTGSPSLATQKQVSDVFASSAPNRQDASLLVTAAELLRGDLPSVLKNFRRLVSRQQKLAQSLGSEFLNVQFGWKPLILEAANVITTMMSLDRALYYESYRRKRAWPGVSWSSSQDSIKLLSTTVSGPTETPMRDGNRSSDGIGMAAQVVESVSFSEDFRFSARYSGHARPSQAANYHNDRALDVIQRLGLVSDPRAIWDLLPYSWLADWATNIGSAMVNANTYSAQTGSAVVDYAYTTRQAVCNRVASISSLLQPTYMTSQAISIARSESTTVSRNRMRANPFGFGVDLTGLNGSQLAILTALGLVRSKL